MHKYARFMRLTMLAVLLVGLLVPALMLAQEATPAGEGETAAEQGEGDPAAVDESQTEGEADSEEGESPAGEEASSPTEGTGEEASEAVEEGAISPLVPLGINQGFLIAQIINFLLLFGLLTFFLWRPLVNMLDSRAAEIQKGLEDASAAANARRNAEAEANKIIAAAKAEAAKVVEDARGRGEEVARTVQTEANTEAERIRAEARARANEERDRQLADLRGQVAAIATAMSERLIGASLDTNRQQQLVSEFFTKLPTGIAGLNGGQVEVVSAMPLTPEEQQRVSTQLGASNVSFTVDPSILGGLIVRSADRVVDGSVRSNLSELAGRLR